MKLVKTANKYFLTMSKTEWEKIGAHKKWLDHKPSDYDQIFEAGKLAAKQGRSMKDNPYHDLNSKDYEMWEDGFRAGSFQDPQF